MLLTVGAALFLILVAVDITQFATSQAARGETKSSALTAVATVQRRPLTARRTVTGTLGYAGVWTVDVPAQTSPAELQQAQQQNASARATYMTAIATLSGDEALLDTVEAEFQAARLKEAADCASASEAASAAPTTTIRPTGAASPTIGLGTCASAIQAAQAAQDAVRPARQKVVSDRTDLTTARTTLASTRRTLESARSYSTAYGGSATFTRLPTPGDVIHRGQSLYAVNGIDTVLFYGSMPAWRGLTAGVPRGRDVAELNANLQSLGFNADLGDTFTYATERAIKAFQRIHRLQVTGSFPLGSVVFEPGAARVTAVTPALGQSAQVGSIMTLSSTRHDVSIQLDVSEQSQVKIGDRVLVNLPDGATTPGVVASVGKVASVQSTNSDSAVTQPSPSLPVHVRLLRPRQAGVLDQAPVNVLVTTASVSNSLVVPVNALVALAGGGYALEVVAKNTRRLIRVRPGLFDDEQGVVQVEGAGLAAGQRVVVPTP